MTLSVVIPAFNEGDGIRVLDTVWAVRAGRAQTAVMQKLLDDGISARRGIMCSRREPAYPGARGPAAPGRVTALPDPAPACGKASSPRTAP